jgi:streptogramin lyase
MTRLVTLALVFAAVLAAPAGAATPTVREFFTDITPSSQPRGIAAGADGNLWFTEFSSASGNRVVRISPSGVVREFATGITAGSQPNGIAAGPDGNVWFTEFAPVASTNKKIGRIAPNGLVTESPVTFPFNTDLGGITVGPDQRLWFTAGGAGMIGAMTTTGTPSVFGPAGISSVPVDIASGADGNLWFTEIDAGNGDKIGRITTSGTVTGEFATSGEPRDIAAGPDGKLWFTQSSPAAIGRLDPAAPAPIDYFTTGISGIPQGIVAGPDGNLWFTEPVGDMIGRITPSGTVTEFSTGITPSSSPLGIVAGPDGNLWFTESNTVSGKARIGRINTSLEPMRFTDRARIQVPDGPANPYPAKIAVSGLQGSVTEVSVRLNGLHHSLAGDVQALLVGPQGQKVRVLAATGPVVTERVITFDDDGVVSAGDLVSGIFKPIIGIGAPMSLPPPAPASPYASTLSEFDGTNPNGEWQLFVQDFVTGDSGVIAGGWSLDIQTTGPAPVEIPGPPVEVQVPGPPTTVTGPGETVTVPGPTITVPGPTVTAPGDTVNPTLTLTGPPARTTQSAFRAGPKVTVTPSEPVTLDVTLAVKPKGATVAAADTLLLFDRTISASRATAITLKPSVKYLGRPKKAFTAVLRIVATDRAGNRATLTRTIAVAPDKKKRSR